MKYKDILNASWNLLEKNPILLLPKVSGIALSTVWFLVIYAIWSLIDAAVLYTVSAEMTQLLLVMLYLIGETFIIFFFSAVGYGFFHQIVHHRKANLKKAVHFAHDRFFHLAGSSMLMYVALGIPLLTIGIILLSNLLVDFNAFVKSTYVALIFIWLALVSWRLIFVYPKKEVDRPTHHAVHASSHFGKVHTRHTLSSWIVVAAIALLITVNRTLLPIGTAVDIWVILMVTILVVAAEMLMSSWEHIVLFEMYMKPSKTSKPKKK
ncbi:MAG: hypothetical protein ACOCWQ_03890 [Nanoarchaeota archaeon]